MIAPLGVRQAARIVKGTSIAQEIVRDLVAHSGIWFEFTPLPDDEYEIRVKAEWSQLLWFEPTHAAPEAV